MRKLTEILRLKFELGLAERKIAAVCGVARSTVQETLKRARAVGLSWPLPPDFDEAAAYAKLYPPSPPHAATPLPDWSLIETELAKKGMTLMLLWQEYQARHPDGLQYSAFCQRYAQFRRSRNLVFRQHHKPGEKLFIDYAGPTLSITDRETGEVKPAAIFVAVLGYSNYTFACATAGQTTADWLGAQRLALEFFGGVPQAIVPDNPKALISKACRFEPDLNPAYQDFARHYATAIVPARVRRPRDKAKVEGGVLIVERWILAKLRHDTFFSLAELNTAIAELVVALNHRPFKKLPGCRHSRFLEAEQATLAPLPERPYEYALWKRTRVHLDYHVEIDKTYYSAPSTLIGQSVDARISARVVELFHRGKLVATHLKNREPGSVTTLDGHRPDRHRAIIELNHERLRERALAMGPATAALIDKQWLAKQHPEQTLRRSLGILRLARDFEPARLEAAAEQALRLNMISYRDVRGLIEACSMRGVMPAAVTVTDAALATHENLRGAAYFGQACEGVGHAY